MTTPEFKITNKTKAGGQVPLEKAKPANTGSSHRKDKGKDTTERSKEGKDKGKNQVTVPQKKRTHSTPQTVDSKYKSSKDKSSHGSNRPQEKDGDIVFKSERPPRVASPRSLAGKLEPNKRELVMVKGTISHSKVLGDEVKLIIGKEQARCKHCSNIFEEHNVLLRKCRCGFPTLLLHKRCATDGSQKESNNKCDVCKERMRDIPVTLSKYQYSDTNKKCKT